jgi:hypothetical protein
MSMKNVREHVPMRIGDAMHVTAALEVRPGAEHANKLPRFALRRW